MAFARAQGSRIVILQSRRSGTAVRQEKLHEFRDFASAWESVESDRRWKLLCESIALALGSRRLDRDRLRASVLRALEGHPKGRTVPSLERLCTPLVQLLESIEGVAQPEHMHLLRESRGILQRLRVLLDARLALLEEQEKPDMLHPTTPERSNAEDFFLAGLGHFERGGWREAAETFQEGLTLDPGHTDLLLYAGHCHSMEGNDELAVKYYARVSETVQSRMDRAIREEPEEFLTIGEIEKRARERGCQFPDEHLPESDGRCEECRASYLEECVTLYSRSEFRPFFHATAAEGHSLLKLRRLEEAIEVFKLSLSYDRQWGISNAVGECYLRIGQVQEAERWYREMLWPRAFYVRALILEQLGRRQEALGMLLEGTFRNVHMARMLLGREKRENVRWMGVALPPPLEASEFMYEEGGLFAGKSGFKALLRVICDDPEIAGLHVELEESIERRGRERGYDMPRRLWNLWQGSATEFFEAHTGRLLSQINDPSHEAWCPGVQSVIQARIVEKKRVNWLMEAPGSDREFYFRPGGFDESLAVGELIEIKVARAWFYRRSLFVAGECLRRV